VSLYVATTLIVALSPVHSDIIRFRSWSPIAAGSHLDLAEPKELCKLLKRLAPLTFLICVEAFRDPHRGELQHIPIFTNDGLDRSREMPSYSAID
jgi:hypothetical protein